MEKIIHIKEFGIEIVLDSGDFSSYGAWSGGTINSALHEVLNSKEYSIEEIESIASYNERMDTIESMILAHAIAGIDVTSKKYIIGIREAIQTSENATM